MKVTPDSGITDNPAFNTRPGSTIASFPAAYARLQALRFALRSKFQDGQTPLKSWEEVREELLSIARDESIPMDLRTKIVEELNQQDEGLLGLLNSVDPEDHKNAGRSVIDRVLEPNEATQFRRSLEYRDRVMSERRRKLIAQGFDDIERDDPGFLSKVIQAAQRMDKTKVKQSGRNEVSREEQHDLLRRFSNDHLGLTSVELASVLQRGEWREHCQSLLDFKVRGKRGAPKKPAAERTRAYHAKKGSPRTLTAEVLDDYAQHTYPDEYAKSQPYSKHRKRLRERVTRHVRPIINKPASPRVT